MHNVPKVGCDGSAKTETGEIQTFLNVCTKNCALYTQSILAHSLDTQSSSAHTVYNARWAHQSETNTRTMRDSVHTLSCEIIIRFLL